MSLDRRIEIDRLLMQALDLDGAERKVFLDGIADPALRADVEEMLALCESDTDPLALDAAAAARLIDAVAEHGSPALASSLGFDAVELPEQIGGWRILDRIGQGGMGEVLKVERIDAGFEQLGAMKLIRSGFAIGEFARRFLQERQILARLNHPGIAGLLDGGRDAQGHPYLVMEYVDGVPIDRYCDAQRLGVETRIELFLEVCRAVAHAHRSLVIHRDLKPSNILVRADGRVKLLDFGIAKVLGDAEGADPLATRIEQRMFTPDYASPEQVRGQPVTTASDVYQLGLLLYELLCGHRAQRVGNTGPAAIERIVCEQDPTRPSQRITTSDAELAARRHLQPGQLRRRLRGDLDTIIGKALQKSPERRYGTVDELIDDLIRSRQGRTLHARPDTWGYRMARFARRHPVGLGFAALTVLLLGVYLVTLNLQAQALERERDRAQAEAAKARQVQSLVQRLFEGIDPDVSGGEPLSVQALLDRSFAQIEGELGAHPEVQAELLLTVGDVYFALGDLKRAGELLTGAQSLAEVLEQEQPQLAARVYRSQGRLLALGNDLELPEQLLRKALELHQAAELAEPLQVANTLFDLADLKRRQNAMDEAKALSEEALALRRSEGSDALQIAASLNQLTMIERGAGNNAHAEAMLREALELMTPRLPATHPRIAEMKADLALVLRNLGKLEAALPLYLEAVEGLTSSRGPQHPTVGIVLGNLGRLLAEMGRYGESEAKHRDALAIHRAHFGERHARVALALHELGTILERLGRRGEAVTAFREALAALPDSHPAWDGRFRRNLIASLIQDGQGSAALEQIDLAERALRQNGGASERDLNNLQVHRARALLVAGHMEPSRSAAQAAIQRIGTGEGVSAELAEAHAVLGEALLGLGRREESTAAFLRSLALYENVARPSPETIGRIRSRIADARSAPSTRPH